MAGICAGPGLTTVEGLLEINGARELAWPNEGSCGIANNNGIRVDPVTGKLWAAPPARMLPKTEAGHTTQATPTVAGTFTLEDQTLNWEVPQCSGATLVVNFAGGFLGQRMGSGNWWQVDRYVTVKRNGITVLYTGLETVAALENNSGGVLGQGGAVDALTLTVTATAGQTLQVLTHYEHRRITFAAHAANDYTWRTPSLVSVLHTHP